MDSLELPLPEKKNEPSKEAYHMCHSVETGSESLGRLQFFSGTSLVLGWLFVF
jgi:hypothetical protein